MDETSLAATLRESQALGFLGPGDSLFHMEHANAFAALIEDGTRILDLGTGGGVPGLVLGVERPTLRITLLDANARRCAFVRAALAGIPGLSERIDVVEGRAEELGRRAELRGRYEVVVSRSFGAPAVTAECGTAFLAPGGRLLVSEPPDAAQSDERWPADGLAQLGLVDHGRVVTGGFGIRVLVLEGPYPERLPRRVGVPAKRPLF